MYKNRFFYFRSRDVEKIGKENKKNFFDMFVKLLHKTKTCKSLIQMQQFCNGGFLWQTIISAERTN